MIRLRDWTSFLALLPCLGASTSQPLAKPAPPREVSAIVYVTVIDCAAGMAVPNQTVVFDGDRITAAGAADTVAPPPGARTVDGTGKFLIPGLWDMHAHVLWTGMDSFFPLMIANGVTAVRDMHTHFPVPVVRKWRQDV